jgi:hypothetical protein
LAPEAHVIPVIGSPSWSMIVRTAAAYQIPPGGTG